MICNHFCICARNSLSRVGSALARSSNRGMTTKDEKQMFAAPDERNGYYMLCPICLLDSYRFFLILPLIHTSPRPLTVSTPQQRFSQLTMLSLLLLALVSQFSLSTSLVTGQERRAGRAERPRANGYPYSASPKFRPQLQARGSVPSGWT